MFLAGAVLVVMSAGGEHPAEETYPLRARILFDGEPAPPGTTLKLLDRRLSVLCGTAQMSAARTAKPEANGWFDFGRVGASTYTLRVAHPALGARSAGTVLVPSSEMPVVDFPGGVSLAARVVDANGAPVEGASVSVVPATSQQIPGGSLVTLLTGNDGMTYDSVRDAQTSSTGEVRFLGLAPGRYAVVARRGDWVISRAVEALGGGAATVKLPATTRLSGRIVDADGHPVPRASVRAEVARPLPEREGLKEGRWAHLFAPVPAAARVYPGLWAKADEDGGFTVETHFRTPLVLTAVASDGCGASRRVEVPGPRSDVTLALLRPRQVTLRPRLPDGSLPTELEVEPSEDSWSSGFKETLPVAEGALRLKVGSRCTSIVLRQPGFNPDGGAAPAKAYAKVLLDGGVSNVDLGIVTLKQRVHDD